MRILTILIITLFCFNCYGESCCNKWKIGAKDGSYTAWTNQGMRTQYPIEYCPECGEPLTYSKEMKIVHDGSKLLGFVFLRKGYTEAEHYFLVHPVEITDEVFRKICDLQTEN